MNVWGCSCSAGCLGAALWSGWAGWAAALLAAAIDCLAPVMLERAKAEALNALPAAFCKAPQIQIGDPLKAELMLAL